MVASIIWLVCVVAALCGAVLRSQSLGELWPYALAGAAPAVLGIALWPVIRKEWAQILIILAWLALAIMACLSIAFIPMAFLFMCAPAAAALFEKEKVIEAMFLAAVFAALLYYAGQKDFMLTDNIATPLQSEWGKTAAIASTVAFLVAAMYGAADSARFKYPSKGLGLDGDMLDAVPGGIVKVSSQNNISFATDTAHTLFNLPSDIGVLPLVALFEGGTDRQVLLDLVERVRRNKSPESRKFTMRDKGHLIHTEISASPLPDNDVLLHIADTTAHEARITGLRQARANAQKDADGKSLFFAGVSHELRTPLNAIIGFSDMMRSRLFGPLPSKYAEYADLIHGSGQHMLDLIGDVLDMAKVEAGKYELIYSNFDAADVVRSSIKMIRPTADAAQLQLEARIIEEPAELLLEADRKALRQMLLNLLSNAVKFTPKGGRIVVSAKSVGGVMNVTVEDNGVGMSAKDLEKVGKPYVQTSSGQNTEQRGSGLGLSLVKSLAELHGGRFALASQKDKGTTAEIYLPLKRRDDAG